MKRFRAIAATTQPDLNGYTLTAENLQAFEGHLAPIIVNYDICNEIGMVDKAYIKDGVLVVEGDIDEHVFDAHTDESPVCIGVSYQADYHPTGSIEVIKPHYYGLITEPSDTGVTPIEEIK